MEIYGRSVVSFSESESSICGFHETKDYIKFLKICSFISFLIPVFYECFVSSKKQTNFSDVSYYLNE